MKCLNSICFLLSYLLLSSCSITNIEYDKQRIGNKEEKGYEVYVDLKPIKLNCCNANPLKRIVTFISNKNVNNVSINKKNRRIDIKRKNSKSFMSLSQMINNDIIKASLEKNEDYLIVIDGVPYSNSDNVYFEEDIIATYKWIDSRELKENTFFHNGRKILIITTMNNV